MRRDAYPLEDPLSLPVPEARMELFLLLQNPIDELGETVEFVTGQQLDCRDWAGSLKRV
jgi:hypothetical protein